MSIIRRSIASALATAFNSTNMTAPSGQSAIVSSTYQLPDMITQTPCVLVFPPEEELSYPAGSWRQSAMEWRVRFFLFRLADTPRQTDALYLWADTLYGQLDDRVHLTLSEQVDNADVVGMKVGTLEYAGEAFDGVEVVIHISGSEAVTFTG